MTTRPSCILHRPCYNCGSQPTSKGNDGMDPWMAWAIGYVMGIVAMTLTFALKERRHG